jgi:prolipoprotein diacylglyceryltransferase
MGRWGNWFNNELYGGPTSLPWRLEIHDIDPTQGVAQPCTFGHIGANVCGYYQPTFLYESIWDLALAGALVLIARHWVIGRGNLFALYVMGYTAGRGWIEALRHDHANHFLGLRLNDWTSIVVFLMGLTWFVIHRNQYDDSLYTGKRAAEQAQARAAPDELGAAEPDPGELDGAESAAAGESDPAAVPAGPAGSDAAIGPDSTAAPGEGAGPLRP